MVYNFADIKINSTLKSGLNYIGQIRIYSLLDLALLLIAVKASTELFIGALLLHLGFIAYLEYSHAHKNRNKIPFFISIILAITGLILYQKIEAILFLVAGYFYTKKKKEPWSFIAPLLRGLQFFLIVGGITGYNNILPLMALIVLILRNFVGDLRDIKKDRKEKMKTLPIIFGFKKDLKHLHLICILGTTLLWWSLTQFNPIILILIWIIQILSYTLTPR